MELKSNIVRDVLLDIEELHEYPNGLIIWSVDDFKRCKIYDFNEILYHLKLLAEADFIDWHPKFASNQFHHGSSSGLTFQGHEFLNTIRGEQVWKKTQNILGQIGSFSIDIMKDVASKTLSEIIKNQF